MKQYKQDMERIHAPDHAKTRAFGALTQNNRRPRSALRLALVAAVMLVLAGSFALLPHTTEPPPHTEASSQTSDILSVPAVSESTSATVESAQSESASSDLPDESEPSEEPDYSELIGALGPTASTVGKETAGEDIPDSELPNYTEPFIGIGGYSALESPEATTQKTNGKYLWRVCGGLSENWVLKTYVLDGANTRLTSEILLSVYDTAMPSYLLQEGDRLIVLTTKFGTYTAQTESDSQKGSKPRTEIRIYDLSEDPGNPLLIKTLYQDGNATLCKLKDGKLSVVSGYKVTIFNVEGKEPIDLSRPEWLNQCLPAYTDSDQTTLLSPDQLFVCEEGNKFSVFTEIDVTEGKFESASSVIGNSVIRFETETRYYMFSESEQHDCRIQSFVLQDGKPVQTAASGTFYGFASRCYEQNGYIYVFASRPYPDEPLYLHVLDDSLQTVASIIANEDRSLISEFHFRDSFCFLQESSYTNEIVLRSVIDLSDPTAPRLLDAAAYEPINTRTQVYNDDLSLNLARVVHVNAIGVRFYENVLTMYDTSDPANHKVVSEYHAKDPYSFGLGVKFILPERGLICLAGSALWYEDKWETIDDTGIILLHYDEQTSTFEQVYFCGTPYHYGNPCETVVVGDCLYVVKDDCAIAIDLNTFEEIAAI